MIFALAGSRRFATRCGCALLLACAMPLHAEVLDSSAFGFTVENRHVVRADPQTAWRALVADVDRWWPKDHSWFGEASTLRIEPVAGGCFCESDGERQVEHMRIAFVDPGRLLRMLGGLGPMQGMGLHGALDWRIEAVEAGTALTLRYVVGGYSTEDLTRLAPVVDRVQRQQLGGLVHWLERERD
ncbi:MAG: hypothetical protein PHP86_07350 [Nevskiales bacterium]|nr:hypothetical protein [Nevskiales bacterium]